tara:strand:+ start:631 stop:999 length:369 start_codon:yes stop_codon:yes gene_type:complete
MRIIILFSLFFLGLFGQEDPSKVSNPCNHPLMQLAKNKGIKSIPIRDIFKYRSLKKQCEENGNGDIVELIHKMDWERDFKSSKTMAGWTSTHAIIVFSTFAYYYFAKVLDVPFDVKFFPENS